jgi:hypothetical protein
MSQENKTCALEASFSNSLRDLTTLQVGLNVIKINGIPFDYQYKRTVSCMRGLLRE